MRVNIRHRACLTLFLLCLFAPSVKADTSVRNLAPGVTLTQEIDRKTPLLIHVLSIDLNVSSVHLGVGIGQDQVGGVDVYKGRENVSDFARRHRVLAAVNADFFPYTGDPLGIGIVNGELFSEPWTGNAKGGPRTALGVLQDGHHVVFDTLGFLGDLQAADGQRVAVNGINRPAGNGEIIVYTSLYGDTTMPRKGGTQIVVRDVNLPVRANKLMVGQVESVLSSAMAAQTVPPDGVVISAGNGRSTQFLIAHMHAGDRVGFVMGIAPPSMVASAVQIAQLPRVPGDLPSRSGLQINRQAFEWAGVRNAVGGGPRLLVHGKIVVPAQATLEGFDAGFSNGANPRTAVGTNAAGTRLIVVTVDGRQAISKGVSLVDLARIMQRYGAYEAMNLDGGGSTAMVVAGMVVNSPSGTGDERPVADMLLILSDKPAVRMASQMAPRGLTDPDAVPPPARYTITTPSAPVAVGSATTLHLLDGTVSVTDAVSSALWQGTVGSDAGYVTQQGVFVALKPGTAKITVTYNGEVITAPIIVQGPVVTPPVLSTAMAILASFAPSVDGQNNYNQLTIKVVDASGIAKSSVPVRVVVNGGIADTTSTQTNLDGYVTVGVTWDAEKGGSVTITGSNLTPVTVTRPAPAN